MPNLDPFYVAELCLDDGPVSEVSSDGGLADGTRLQLDTVLVLVSCRAHPLVKRVDLYRVLTVLQLHESDVNSTHSVMQSVRLSVGETSQIARWTRNRWSSRSTNQLADLTLKMAAPTDSHLPSSFFDFQTAIFNRQDQKSSEQFAVSPHT